MSMSVGGSFNPYDVIAFVQEHADKYASMIKGEMQRAEDRSQLVRDIADFSAGLEDAKNRGDWHKARELVGDFMSKHPETWGGASMDMVSLYCNTKAWDEGQSIVPGSYVQQNYPGGTTWGESFHSDWTQTSDVDTGSAQSNLDEWIKRVNDWKDKVAGDDKIGLMTLQEDAEQMKNLYEKGSNLVAKEDQIASLIISNIGKG